MSRCKFLLTLLAVGLSFSTVSAQEPAPKKIPAWGLWVDPDADCQFKVVKGQLTVSVPGWTHDLSAERVKMNAPRVVQDITADHAIQATISGKFEPGDASEPNRAPYMSAGLLVFQDNRNYVRLERCATVNPKTHQVTHTIVFEVRANGAVQRVGSANDLRVEPNAPVILRLERHNNRIFGFTSKDGMDWQELGEKSLGKEAKMTAGLTVINLTSASLDAKFAELVVEELDPLPVVEPEEEEDPKKKVK